MTRVPGSVKDDDPVGPDEVDAEASGSGGHEEELDLGVGVEAVDEALPLQGACASIESVIGLSVDPGSL